jgi:uncharacterized protein YqgV (UPF0045/DUF77 family)
MASSSGAIRAGRAFIELFTDDTKLQRGLSIASKKISTFGNGITAMGKRIALLGAAAAAPLGLAVAKASELEETINKFDVVFGGNAKNVKAWSDQFAATMGRSKQQVADFLASTQTLVLPMGFDPKDAEEFSKTIAGLAFDLASFHNTSDADAFAALKSGLVGEAEPLKRYGVLLSEAALKQELLNKGIDINKATNYEKAMGRLAIIMRSTATAQGDVQRSFGSVANQAKAAQASIDNAAASIGTALLPVIARLLGIVTPMIEAVAKWATTNQDAIVAIAAVAAGAASLGVGLVALGSVVTALGATVGGLATAIGLIANHIGAAVIAFGGFQIAVAALNGDLEGAAAIAKDAFSTIAGDATAAVGGIVAALKSGDIETAMKIVSTVIQLEWERMLDAMKAGLDLFAEEVKLFGIVSFKAPERVKSQKIAELEAQLAGLSQGARQTAASGSTAAAAGGAADWISAFTGVNVRGFMPGGQANAPSGLNALAASMSAAVADGLSTAGEFLTSNRVGKGRNAPLGLSGLLSSGLSTASDFMNQIGGGVLTAEKTLSTAGTFNGLLAGQQLSGQKAAEETAENTKNAAKTLVEIRRKINGKPKATA